LLQNIEDDTIKLLYSLLQNLNVTTWKQTLLIWFCLLSNSQSKIKFLKVFNQAISNSLILLNSVQSALFLVGIQKT